MLAYLALRRKSEIENLRQNSTSSDFAQIFTLGAEFCADHENLVFGNVAASEIGQTGIFLSEISVFSDYLSSGIEIRKKNAVGVVGLLIAVIFIYICWGFQAKTADI